MVKRRKLFQMPLEVKSLELEGVTQFRPRKFVDTRGYFVETFNAKSYAEAGALGTPSEAAGSSLAHSGLLSALAMVILVMVALGLSAHNAEPALVATTWVLRA